MFTFSYLLVYNMFKELIVLNRIKLLRTEHNINQDVLAKLLCLEVAGVSKLETGRVPLKDEYIIKLANYFDVTTDYILGQSPIKNNKNIPLDTSKLDKDDIAELQRHINYIKKLKNIS